MSDDDDDDDGSGGGRGGGGGVVEVTIRNKSDPRIQSVGMTSWQKREAPQQRPPTDAASASSAASARKIQAQFRGHQQRQQDNQRSASAVKIQAQFRGQRERSAGARRKDAAGHEAVDAEHANNDHGADADHDDGAASSEHGAPSAGSAVAGAASAAAVRADQDTKDTFGPSLTASKKTTLASRNSRARGGKHEEGFYELRTPQNSSATTSGGIGPKMPGGPGGGGVGPMARIRQLEEQLKVGG